MGLWDAVSAGSATRPSGCPATESIEALVRTMFLHAGHLVEHGDTAQVFEHPAHEETVSYIAGQHG